MHLDASDIFTFECLTYANSEHSDQVCAVLGNLILSCLASVGAEVAK